MSVAMAISFGKKTSFKIEHGDAELNAFGYTITALWYSDPFNGGFFIHKGDADFDHRWTWPEVAHRLKFWRRDEFRWPPHK